MSNVRSGTKLFALRELLLYLTLQDWEQGRRQPSGAAKTLIAIAERRPDVLKEITA